MTKDIRKVRKSINRRKKLRSPTSENNTIYQERILPPLPSEEEKHGFFPGYLENTSPEKNDGNKSPQFLIKGALSFVLFLSVALIWNTDSSLFSKAGSWTNEALTEEFPFAKVNRWYKETFGSPLSLTEQPVQPAQSTNALALPVNGNIAESFEDNGEGILITPEEQVQVSALEEGFVIFSGKDKQTDNTVVVQHPDGSKTTYGHLNTVDVHLYQFIETNQVIGQFTPTEESDMVYFSIQKDQKYVDPLQVIKVDDNQ